MPRGNTGGDGTASSRRDPPVILPTKHKVPLLACPLIHHTHSNFAAKPHRAQSISTSGLLSQNQEQNNSNNNQVSKQSTHNQQKQPNAKSANKHMVEININTSSQHYYLPRQLAVVGSCLRTIIAAEKGRTRTISKMKTRGWHQQERKGTIENREEVEEEGRSSEELDVMSSKYDLFKSGAFFIASLDLKHSVPQKCSCLLKWGWTKPPSQCKLLLTWWNLAWSKELFSLENCQHMACQLEGHLGQAAKAQRQKIFLLFFFLSPLPRWTVYHLYKSKKTAIF